MSDILIVAAHPDDEVLGAGGTLAKHVDDGDDVYAVVLSEGVSSRYDEGMESTLRAAGERCADVLGLADITFLALPDQRLDAVPLIDVTQKLEPLIQKLRPEVVYTHSPVDVNADHGVVCRAAWTACRPYATPWLKKFACFETPSSTEWAWPLSDAGFQPQHFVDVSTSIDRKLEAMGCYETELRDYPHPRSTQALRERAAFWGSQIGVSAAEPFVILRSLG